ncbi:DNA-binding anti-repressor SinI [Bacillus salacetis]|uniref:DNA-binding anti-repressor SinI n=1 Tax=Bacillus salacetis TaxID=2315464 RepID=A0A3A1R5T4_9BACI|nr:anti-repressor SinI family protein [Bacillus salacetis]RIW36102.1 DNA-binding anti-repressor SinI [Bacillus salacetis]
MVERELDLEWITLIKEAMAVGVTKDEILEYLHTNREKSKVLVK